MITKEDIIEMKKLREDGLTMREIGEKFKVSRATVSYHVNPETKRKRIIKVVEAFRRRSPEQKRKTYLKNRAKVLEYQNRRYREDEAFREKRKAQAREYYRRKHAKHNKNS